MELHEIEKEIRKVIRAAYNVESTKMKQGETLTVNISIPGSVVQFGEFTEDLCYNEAFMHGLVFVEDPYIKVFKDERISTSIKLVMLHMRDVPYYIRNHPL
jgi:hypothetical protein